MERNLEPNRDKYIHVTDEVQAIQIVLCFENLHVHELSALQIM